MKLTPRDSAIIGLVMIAESGLVGIDLEEAIAEEVDSLLDKVQTGLNPQHP